MCVLDEGNGQNLPMPLPVDTLPVPFCHKASPYPPPSCPPPAPHLDMRGRGWWLGCDSSNKPLLCCTTVHPWRCRMVEKRVMRADLKVMDTSQGLRAQGKRGRRGGREERQARGGEAAGKRQTCMMEGLLNRVRGFRERIHVE